MLLVVVAGIFASGSGGNRASRDAPNGIADYDKVELDALANAEALENLAGNLAR